MTLPTPRLLISPTDTGDAVLVLAGEIDAHTANELSTHLDPLPGIDGDVTLDLSGIDFVDSSGLRVIVEAHRRADDAGRRLVLRRPSPSVTRLLDITGLGDHLVIDETHGDDHGSYRDTT